jgi:tetratricopeptide (TPR) repeat protein
MNPHESAIEEYETLDLLTALVDKSLVAYDELTGRYRLLETVRQFSLDRLMESGDGERWRNRHLDHVLALAEEAEAHLTGPDQRAWLVRLEAEHDNLRSALDWSGEDLQGAGRGLRLAAALSRFWYVHGNFAEGRERLACALARDRGTDSALRAQGLNAAGSLAYCQADFEAALLLFEESHALRLELGDRRGIAALMNNLGNVAHAQGDSLRAHAMLEENLALYRQTDDRRGITTSLNNLGIVARDLGDFVEARKLYEESVTICRELGDLRGISYALNNLGTVALDQCDYVAARAFLAESLTLKRQIGDLRGIAESLGRIADLVAEVGAPVRAACLWGATERLRSEIGAPLTPNNGLRNKAQVANCRAALSDAAAFDAALTRGRAMTLEQAIEFALSDAVE